MAMDSEMHPCHWCGVTKTTSLLQVGMRLFTPETVTLYPGASLPDIRPHQDVTVQQPCCSACANQLFTEWCDSTLVRTMLHDKHHAYLPLERAGIAQQKGDKHGH
jgi:hypothetical protein